jgi:uncharacterized protein
MESKFHFAFKIKDIASTKAFYHDIIGCELGRETEHWVDFNFFGHQLSAHVSTDLAELDYCGKVDSVKVPIPHFGCILNAETFQNLKERFEENKVEFVIKPIVRYQGQVGEQQTMFVLDYSNNPLEFKSYSDKGEIFA